MAELATDGTQFDKMLASATKLQAAHRGHHARELMKEISDVKSEFEENGFYSDFGEFNIELFRPFKRMEAEAPPKLSVMSACGVCLKLMAPLLMTCPNPFKPSSESSRKIAFVIWNVVCFWLGVFDLLLIFLLKSEKSSVWAWLIAIVDGALGYLFAYTFYFLFISYAKPEYMRIGLYIMGLYVLGTAYLTYEGLAGPGGHIDKSEGIVNGCKAVANAVEMYWGIKIYLGCGFHVGAGNVRASKVEVVKAAETRKKEMV